VCVCERERECVCVCVYMCICVSVCVRERERVNERKRRVNCKKTSISLEFQRKLENVLDALNLYSNILAFLFANFSLMLSMTVA